MSVCKRKIDECHYCANQKRHDRKRRKLAVPDNSELAMNLVPDGNFKCRGRGGKEIEFEPEDATPMIISKTFKPLDAGREAISLRNHDRDHKMNLKPRPEQSVGLMTDRLPCQNLRSSSHSRSGRTNVSCSSDTTHEIRLSTAQTKPELCSSVDDLSIKSKDISRTESVASDFSDVQYDIRSFGNLRLVGTTDGGSSADESSFTTCLTRSRNAGKTVGGCEEASANLKLTSLPQTRKSRYTLTEESRSLRTSSESVSDYLMNVSEELKGNRLLGKLEEADEIRKKLIHSEGHTGTQGSLEDRRDRLKMYNEFETKSNSTFSRNRPYRTRKFQQVQPTKSSSMVQSFPTTQNPLTKDGSFWTKVFQLLSLGCWKADINSSPQNERKTEVDTVSECGGSSSSENSSTSTGTTTVAAVTCGRLSARTRSDDAKSTPETLTAKIPSSRSSGTGDRKLLTAKLVESLKRFFLRHRKSDSNRTPCEEDESASDSSCSAESTSEPSSSAPLNPKQQSLSPNQQAPVEHIQKASALSNRNHRAKPSPSPESERSNKLLLDDSTGLSTENEMSDSEIVDVWPTRKQPI